MWAEFFWFVLDFSLMCEQQRMIFEEIKIKNKKEEKK